MKTTGSSLAVASLVTALISSGPNTSSCRQYSARQLAAFVVECMSSSDKELGNAAATCFLENLTHERFSKDFENYLAGDALDFYRRFQGT